MIAKISQVTLVLVLSLTSSLCADVDTPETMSDLSSKLASLETKFKETMKKLATQTMNLQFAMEERTRSDGDSGIKNVRGLPKGPDNYFENGLRRYNRFADLHDMSQYEGTVGMGEVTAVLNGVEFRTRSNNYKLKMPSTTSKDFLATEDVPMPDVPPEVLTKADVKAQVLEMREWFKAFQAQDPSVRDYRKYFSPILCYMEAAWTTDLHNIHDFYSATNFLDAKNMFDLRAKVRYNAYTGDKHSRGNLASLPTNIMEVNSEGVPTYAQWNYRILCHPISHGLELSDFELQKDFAFAVPRGSSNTATFNSLGARFRLHSDKFSAYSKLDQFFAQVPGMDNSDTSQAETAEGLVKTSQDGAPLNANNYHRFYKTLQDNERPVATGFNDANLWVAKTTQEGVAAISLKICKGFKKGSDCSTRKERYSYAIPLEIIYLTPLHKWNPYNLEMKTGRRNSVKLLSAKERLSLPEMSQGQVWNGVDSKHFFRTPYEFYENEKRESVLVLDGDNNTRQTTVSGVRTFAAIPGLGKIRLRYPIAPVHGEGSAVWKELNALKHFVDDGFSDLKPPRVQFMVSPASTNRHTHTFNVSFSDYKKMLTDGEEISIVTSSQRRHRHWMDIRYVPESDSFEYVRCGNTEDSCSNKRKKNAIAECLECPEHDKHLILLSHMPFWDVWEQDHQGAD